MFSHTIDKEKKKRDSIPRGGQRKMKKHTAGKVIAPIVVAGMMLSAMPFTYAGTVPAPQKEQDVIVVYKNDAGKQAILKESNEVDHQFKSVPAVAVTVDQKDLAKLEDNPNIKYVEENITFSIQDAKAKIVNVQSTTSNTSTVSAEESQWSLQDVVAPDAWKSGFTGTGVKVAVVDSGIATNHPDLTVTGGISTVDYTSSYNDDNGHGSHVAGIIGAKRNNSGMVGIAPDVQLYAVKTMDSQGKGNLQDVLEGIDWAIQNKMDIINVSLGTSADSQLLHDMVDKAYNQGILVVGAGGNNGTADGSGDTVSYPAKYDSVIAVSAVDKYNKRGSFSATGNKIEVSAPGVDVISTYLNGKYAIASGTSQASPHVAGMLALLKQKNPTMTNKELRAELLKYTQDLGITGKDTFYGNGFVQYKTLPTEPQVIQITPAIQTQITKTETAVKNAEKYQKTTYVTTAQKAIDLLPEGLPQKEAFQQRLEVVANAIAQTELNANLVKAETAVDKAEKYKSSYYVTSAQKAIDVLPSIAQKVELQQRLDTLKEEIAQAELKANLDKAEKAVKNAEKYKTSSYYFDTAQKLVTALPNVPEKEAMQKRLDTLKAPATATTSSNGSISKATLDSVELSVKYAEKYSRVSYYKTKAQGLVSKLPNGVEKTAFQKRLDAIK